MSNLQHLLCLLCHRKICLLCHRKLAGRPIKVVVSPSIVQVDVKPEEHGDPRRKPADGQSHPVGLVPRSLLPPLQWKQEAVAKYSARPSQEKPAKSVPSSSLVVKYSDEGEPGGEINHLQLKQTAWSLCLADLAAGVLTKALQYASKIGDRSMQHELFPATRGACLRPAMQEQSPG